MGRGAVRLLLSLVIAGLLSACNGNSENGSEPTLPPPPSTTTTIDVSKVPPTIDVPYVQAVMDTLDKVTGDAVRVFVAKRGPNQEWYETFRAVFEEDLFKKLEGEFGNFAARGLEPLRASPENPQTVVKRLVDSSSTCVVAEVDRTFGPVLREPPLPEAIPGFVQLNPKRSQRDPAGRNPSGWSLVADIDAKGSSIPENPCP